ncbi:hypothetical protein GOP47_0006909 [Adiantum capillus-veneris]|uniref:Uncharacterized protein n=1 Tax=Adiantum capillus-veneris TaxID=13818 RepID=A0A9D4UZP3_ADICA|nr:hypothetical protein GOP47_0006909 [Adiantum capillus-veneris]
MCSKAKVFECRISLHDSLAQLRPEDPVLSVLCLKVTSFMGSVMPTLSAAPHHLHRQLNQLCCLGSCHI